MGSDREMENVGAGWGEVSTCGPPGACAQSVGASSHGAVCKCGTGQGSMGKQEAGYQGRTPAGAGCAFLGAGQGERSRQMQALQEMCRVKTIPGIGGVTVFITSLSGFGAS